MIAYLHVQLEVVTGLYHCLTEEGYPLVHAPFVPQAVPVSLHFPDALENGRYSCYHCEA